MSEILNVEEDLVGLLLNDCSADGKEEVELLMEAYNSDLKEIQGLNSIEFQQNF